MLKSERSGNEGVACYAWSPDRTLSRSSASLRFALGPCRGPGCRCWTNHGRRDKEGSPQAIAPSDRLSLADARINQGSARNRRSGVAGNSFQGPTIVGGSCCVKNQKVTFYHGYF